RRHEVLCEHVPLLGELRADVGIERAYLAGWLVQWHQARETGGQAAAARGAVVRDVRLEEVRRVEGKPQVGSRAFHVLRDPVAAAEDPAVALPVGEAQPRLEALVVGLVERAVLDASVLGQDLLARLQREIRLPVVLLHERLRVGPPQTEVEGEVGRDLEVVLHEERDAVVEVRPRIRSAAAPLAPNLVEEEVGERGSREGAAVAEDAQQAIVAGIEALLHVMKELAAELQGMTAPHPRQLLVELVGLVPGVRVARSRPDGRERAPLPGADLDRAEAGDGLTAADVERRVRVPDAGPVERLLYVRDLVEAEQHLVDESRAEDVAPVQSQVSEWPVLPQSQDEGER